eukprot:g8028.t1
MPSEIPNDVKQKLINDPRVQEAAAKTGKDAISALQDPEVQRQIMETCKEKKIVEFCNDPEVQAAAKKYAALAGAYVMKAGGALVAQIEQGPAGIRFLCFLGSLFSMANAILKLISSSRIMSEPVKYVLSIYQLLFSITTVLFDARKCKFLSETLGRGGFYIFQGTLWLCFASLTDILDLAAGVALVGCGGLNLLMHFGGLAAFQEKVSEACLKLQDGHASRTPNTHVRFPRLTELLRSGKALAVRPVVPEYGKMIGIMEAQMVLGHSWTAEVTATSKALGLLQWFLPYVLTISALLVLAVAALQPSEAFWVPLLLPLLLPLQQLRCRIWNRQLLQAVDKAAFADAFDQLRAPLGWGEDGQYFSANLVSAMQALDVQPGELLTSMRSRLEWKLYICCTLVFVAPAVMFIKIDGMEAAQVPVLLLCALSLLAACTPGKAKWGEQCERQI